MLWSAGNALEKAGGRDFLEAVKELRKAQGPLEVASGMETRTPKLLSNLLDERVCFCMVIKGCNY